MRQYLCSVALADNPQHVVTNKAVTIAEIAVLRRIHGDAAVRDIRPPADKALRDVDRTEPEERERLRALYDAPAPGDNEPIVDRLFGPMAALPTSLRQIGIDPAAAADEMKRQAEMLAQAAAQLSEEDEPEAADEDTFFDEVEADAPKPSGKKAA